MAKARLSNGWFIFLVFVVPAVIYFVTIISLRYMEARWEMESMHTPIASRQPDLLAYAEDGESATQPATAPATPP